MAPVHRPHHALMLPNHDGGNEESFGNSIKHSLGGMVGTATTTSSPNTTTSKTIFSASLRSNSNRSDSGSEATTTSSHTSIDEHKNNDEEDDMDMSSTVSSTSSLLVRLPSIEVVRHGEESADRIVDADFMGLAVPEAPEHRVEKSGQGRDNNQDEEEKVEEDTDEEEDNMSFLEEPTAQSSLLKTDVLTDLAVPKAPEHHMGKSPQDNNKSIVEDYEEEKVEEDADQEEDNLSFSEGHVVHTTSCNFQDLTGSAVPEAPEHHVEKSPQDNNKKKDEDVGEEKVEEDTSQEEDNLSFSEDPMTQTTSSSMIEDAAGLIVLPEAPQHHTEKSPQDGDTNVDEDNEEEKVEEASYQEIPISDSAETTTTTTSAASRSLRRSKIYTTTTNANDNGQVLTNDESRAPDSGESQALPSLSQQTSSASWDMDDDDVLTEMPPSAATESPTLTKKLSLNSRRSVEFSHVHIREYNVTIGDNPCCSYGAPVSLDWDYVDEQGDIPLDVYEQKYVLPRQAMKRRSRRSLVLNYTERRARLWRAGYTLEEIDAAAKELEKEKWRQSMLGNLEGFYRLQEVWVLYVKPVIFKRNREQRHMDQRLDYIEQKVRDEHDHSSRSLRLSECGDELPGFALGDLGDLENQPDVIEGLVVEQISSSQGTLPQQQPPVVFNRMNSHHSSGSGSGSGDTPNKYGIRVDKKQQDKATEIKLCSLRRPHMRAFHAAWFSFFMAFFSWFAITPLLSEIQDTLDLETSQIWMSSLFGTAGTIVFRILMGPLCDKFGARVCMAAILAVAAIPTALTGLVQTSAGLSLVRLFIGIGGSSFVACQYWTSEMFSRETVGTANALVAGWGNLGGGVTNLIMGSVLFPLFRWFFRREDDDDDDDSTSSELAWRTVFVVPALLSIMTALLIVCYCDDSPKGSYEDRIKNEKLAIASPLESLKAAARNWNVWILSFQYACCFGVEVTMTNATALYFKDEFGQTTVSAAGIASIFGFMNIFARGLGGLGSDKCQNLKGTPGRLFWQMTTLVFEGVAIGIFAIADSMAASIVALVFLSCMVQAAEGSTFGIVPYVDRRFTGSVVGMIGAGGNFGAVIFSIFFVLFSYRAAFTLMGVSALGSAFLSLLMQTSKLAQTHEEINLEFEQREQDHHQEERLLQPAPPQAPESDDQSYDGYHSSDIPDVSFEA